MKFKVEADLEKMDRLKTKVDDLKKSMNDLNEKTDPKKMRDLESQLIKTEKEFINVGASVQKTTTQMQDMESVGGKAVKGVAETLKQAITNQKQLIREIKKDIDDLNSKSKDKSLSPGQKSEVTADLAAAKRALSEEKGALLGMQSKQIEMNAAEMASQGGLIAMAGKWVTGLLSVGMAMKFLKTTIESTEKTGQMYEVVTHQITEATAYFFKTLASGDWSNFLEGLGKAITGAREYVEEMENLQNLSNQQKVQSSMLDVKIGSAFADSYSTDPKVQKKALEEILKLNREKYTGEAKIAKESYKIKAQEIADRNGWNLKDLENTITYYTKMKPIIEDGERYIALMQARDANKGGMVGETYVKGNQKALSKIDAEIMNIPNGNYAAGIARSFGKVTFPERDEVAGLLAQSNTAESQIEMNNKRIQMRLRSLRAQEESEAKAVEKLKTQYAIEVGKRRVDTALDIEQQVINAEKDGIEKSRHQAELNYKKTMAELDQRKAEMLRKQNEMSGGIDKDTGRKTKTYNSKLNPLDQGQIDQLGTLAASVRDKAVLDQLLIDFENFQQKRLRITDEYDKKIKLLAGTPAAAEAEYQKQEALDALDKQIAARSAIYTRWSKDLASKSLDDIDSLLKDYQNISVKLNKDSGLGDDDKAVLREQVRALQVRIQELTSNKNTIKEGKKDQTETLRTMNEINEAARNIIATFANMDDARATFTSIINISGGVITALTGIEKTGTAAFAALGSAEKASVILAVMGAVIQVYNSINSVFKSIADKQQEKLNMDREEYLGLLSYNEELRAKYEWTKKIGEATAGYLKREGEELAKQSSANEKEQADLFKKLQGERYKTDDKNGFLEKNWWNKGTASLEGKTYEDIAKLASEGKLTKEAQSYYEALKKAKEEGADLIKMQDEYLEKLRETYTGTTYDSVVTSIIEGFKAGKRGAADFADTFGDLMRGALLSSLELLSDEKVRAWYERFATLSSNGLTAEEKALLKKEWDGIINDLTVRAKNMEDVTGVSLTDTTSSSKGSSSSFSSMSQDSADKLEGRFMAVQIVGEGTRDAVLATDTKLGLLVELNASMSESAVQVLEETRNLRTVQIQSMYYLEDIAKYTKVLPAMAEDIARVKKNTEGLTR